MVRRTGAADETTVTERAAHWPGPAVITALETASAHFAGHVSEINSLNVFPVPDGDTGTNMHLTLQAALREAHLLDRASAPTAGAVLGAVAHGALMGARGNSGVILYQVLVGVAEANRDADTLDGPGLAAGLRRGTELAYRAVVTPVEGTMLTVIRAAAEAASAAARHAPTLGPVLAATIRAAEEALRRTPEQLDILRQAGVVDAGGRGLVVLLHGLERFVEGLPAEAPPADVAPDHAPVAAAMDFLDQIDVLHGTDSFGYCTNFVVIGERIPFAEFRARMQELGTSAVVVGDSRAVKVHIHTDHPGRVLEAALGYGELEQVRIDNMTAQARDLRAERAAQQPPAPWLAPAAPIAVVCVANGEGIAAALRGMGATSIVPGGPTFNPSTEDLARAVEALPQEEIIVLPNDSNVIPTARQVERLTGRAVRVVPSRSIPQGISALSAFNLDAGLDENVEAMTRALGLVRTLAMTRASRDARIGPISVRAGEFIGMLDGELRAAGGDPVRVLLDLLGQAEPGAAELLTLFTGQDAAPDLAARVTAAVGDAYPHLTVETTAGGQPHYDLILALE